MRDKVKMQLCFEVEADKLDAYMLKRALRDHPGAPMWLRVRLEQALERVVRDAQGGGAWRFRVEGGALRALAATGRENGGS